MHIYKFDCAFPLNRNDDSASCVAITVQTHIFEWKISVTYKVKFTQSSFMFLIFLGFASEYVGLIGQKWS